MPWMFLRMVRTSLVLLMLAMSWMGESSSRSVGVDGAACRRRQRRIVSQSDDEMLLSLERALVSLVCLTVAVC